MDNLFHSEIKVIAPNSGTTPKNPKTPKTPKNPHNSKIGPLRIKTSESPDALVRSQSGTMEFQSSSTRASTNTRPGSKYKATSYSSTYKSVTPDPSSFDMEPLSIDASVIPPARAPHVNASKNANNNNNNNNNNKQSDHNPRRSVTFVDPQQLANTLRDPPQGSGVSGGSGGSGTLQMSENMENYANYAQYSNYSNYANYPTLSIQESPVLGQLVSPSSNASHTSHASYKSSNTPHSSREHPTLGAMFWSKSANSDLEMDIIHDVADTQSNASNASNAPHHSNPFASHSSPNRARGSPKKWNKQNKPKHKNKLRNDEAVQRYKNSSKTGRNTTATLGMIRASTDRGPPGATPGPRQNSQNSKKHSKQQMYPSTTRASTLSRDGSASSSARDVHKLAASAQSSNHVKDAKHNRMPMRHGSFMSPSQPSALSRGRKNSVNSRRGTQKNGMKRGKNKNKQMHRSSLSVMNRPSALDIHRINQQAKFDKNQKFENTIDRFAKRVSQGMKIYKRRRSQNWRASNTINATNIHIGGNNGSHAGNGLLGSEMHNNPALLQAGKYTKHRHKSHTLTLESIKNVLDHPGSPRHTRSTRASTETNGTLAAPQMTRLASPGGRSSGILNNISLAAARRSSPGARKPRPQSTKVYKTRGKRGFSTMSTINDGHVHGVAVAQTAQYLEKFEKRASQHKERMHAQQPPHAQHVQHVQHAQQRGQGGKVKRISIPVDSGEIVISLPTPKSAFEPEYKDKMDKMERHHEESVTLTDMDLQMRLTAGYSEILPSEEENDNFTIINENYESRDQAGLHSKSMPHGQKASELMQDEDLEDFWAQAGNEMTTKSLGNISVDLEAVQNIQTMQSMESFDKLENLDNFVNDDHDDEEQDQHYRNDSSSIADFVDVIENSLKASIITNMQTLTSTNSIDNLYDAEPSVSIAHTQTHAHDTHDPHDPHDPHQMEREQSHQVRPESAQTVISIRDRGFSQHTNDSRADTEIAETLEMVERAQTFDTLDTPDAGDAAGVTSASTAGVSPALSRNSSVPTHRSSNNNTATQIAAKLSSKTPKHVSTNTKKKRASKTLNRTSLKRKSLHQRKNSSINNSLSLARRLSRRLSHASNGSHASHASLASLAASVKTSHLSQQSFDISKDVFESRSELPSLYPSVKTVSLEYWVRFNILLPLTLAQWSRDLFLVGLARALRLDSYSRVRSEKFRFKMRSAVQIDTHHSMIEVICCCARSEVIEVKHSFEIVYVNGVLEQCLNESLGYSKVRIRYASALLQGDRELGAREEVAPMRQYYNETLFYTLRNAPLRSADDLKYEENLRCFWKEYVLKKWSKKELKSMSFFPMLLGCEEFFKNARQNDANQGLDGPEEKWRHDPEYQKFEEKYLEFEKKWDSKIKSVYNAPNLALPLPAKMPFEEFDDMPAWQRKNLESKVTKVRNTEKTNVHVASHATQTDATGDVNININNINNVTNVTNVNNINTFNTFNSINLGPAGRFGIITAEINGSSAGTGSSSHGTGTSSGAAAAHLSHANIARHDKKGIISNNGNHSTQSVNPAIGFFKQNSMSYVSDSAVSSLSTGGNVHVSSGNGPSPVVPNSGASGAVSTGSTASAGPGATGTNVVSVTSIKDLQLETIKDLTRKVTNAGSEEEVQSLLHSVLAEVVNKASLQVNPPTPASVHHANVNNSDRNSGLHTLQSPTETGKMRRKSKTNIAATSGTNGSSAANVSNGGKTKQRHSGKKTITRKLSIKVSDLDEIDHNNKNEHKRKSKHKAKVSDSKSESLSDMAQIALDTIEDESDNINENENNTDSELIDMSPTAEEEEDRLLPFERSGAGRVSRISVLLPEHELHGLIAPLLLKSQIHTAANSAATSLLATPVGASAMNSINPALVFVDDMDATIFDSKDAKESKDSKEAKEENGVLAISKSIDGNNSNNMETITEEIGSSVSPWRGSTSGRDRKDAMSGNDTDVLEQLDVLNAISLAASGSDGSDAGVQQNEDGSVSPREGTILHYLTFG